MLNADSKPKKMRERESEKSIVKNIMPISPHGVTPRLCGRAGAVSVRRKLDVGSKADTTAGQLMPFWALFPGAPSAEHRGEAHFNSLSQMTPGKLH